MPGESRRFRIVWGLVTLTLAGCGGGSGGGGTPAPQSYSIGGSVSGLAAGESVALANNASDTLSVDADGTFVFSSKLTQGSSYAVTVATQPPGQSCTVSMGSGSNLAADVTSVAVACVNKPQYAYVVNNGDNTVSQYSIASNGTLTALGTPVATELSPQSITIDPSHHYAYVTNLTSNTISQYVIQSDGTLSPNTPATVATLAGPWAVTFSPSGAFAYVVNSGSNNVTVYSVGANGALTATSQPPTSTGVEPWNFTISPDGKYAYVADHGNVAPGGKTISQYSVNSSTGALTPLNPATVALVYAYPGGITVDPTSSYAYLANINGDSIAQFAIGADGTLSSLNPATVATGTEPVELAFAPSGKFAYAANYTVDVTSAQGTVSQYAVGTGGQLTPLAVPTVAAGIGPGWFAFDAFGKYAYVVNLGNGTLPGTVTEYSIGSDGSLTQIGAIIAGTSAYMIATTY